MILDTLKLTINLNHHTSLSPRQIPLACPEEAIYNSVSTNNRRQIKSIQRITHFFYLSNGTYKQNLLEHIKLAMMVPICNPGTRKANRKGLCMQNQFTLLSKTLEQNKNKMKQYMKQKNEAEKISKLYTRERMFDSSLPTSTIKLTVILLKNTDLFIPNLYQVFL